MARMVRPMVSRRWPRAESLFKRPIPPLTCAIAGVLGIRAFPAFSAFPAVGRPACLLASPRWYSTRVAGPDFRSACYPPGLRGKREKQKKADVSISGHSATTLSSARPPVAVLSILSFPFASRGVIAASISAADLCPPKSELISVRVLPVGDLCTN